MSSDMPAPNGPTRSNTARGTNRLPVPVNPTFSM